MLLKFYINRASFGYDFSAKKFFRFKWVSKNQSLLLSVFITNSKIIDFLRAYLGDKLSMEIVSNTFWLNIALLSRNYRCATVFTAFFLFVLYRLGGFLAFYNM